MDLVKPAPPAKNLLYNAVAYYMVWKPYIPDQAFCYTASVAVIIVTISIIVNQHMFISECTVLSSESLGGKFSISLEHNNVIRPVNYLHFLQIFKIFCLIHNLFMFCLFMFLANYFNQISRLTSERVIKGKENTKPK